MVLIIDVQGHESEIVVLLHQTRRPKDLGLEVAITIDDKADSDPLLRREIPEDFQLPIFPITNACLFNEMGVFIHDIHYVRDLRVVKNREIGVKATSEGLLVLILISLHKKDCTDPSALTGRERAGQFISNNESFMRGDIRENGEDMPDELRAGHSHSTDIEGCLE